MSLFLFQLTEAPAWALPKNWIGVSPAMMKAIAGAMGRGEIKIFRGKSFLSQPVQLVLIERGPSYVNHDFMMRLRAEFNRGNSQFFKPAKIRWSYGIKPFSLLRPVELVAINPSDFEDTSTDLKDGGWQQVSQDEISKEADSLELRLERYLSDLRDESIKAGTAYGHLGSKYSKVKSTIENTEILMSSQRSVAIRAVSELEHGSPSMRKEYEADLDLAMKSMAVAEKELLELNEELLRLDSMLGILGQQCTEIDAALTFARRSDPESDVYRAFFPKKDSKEWE